MSTPVIFNGVNYFVPAFGDTGYVQGPGNMSAYWIAIATGTLQPTGGSFPLTGQINFGTNFGITGVNFISTTTNPATIGTLRLAKTDTIDWRNNANTLNLPLGINVSDQLTFNSIVVSTVTANGTVNSGTAGNVAYYAASTNAVSSTAAFTVGNNGPNGIIVGTNTNDNAAVGFVGQYVSSTVSAVNYPVSTTYGDVTSISLTAGDWDVTLNLLSTNLGGTSGAPTSAGVSTTPGNSIAGLVIGDNWSLGETGATANNIMQSVPAYRISLSATTTVYAKFRADYAGTAPAAYARLSARRVR